MQQYIKKNKDLVVAVQINLDTDGLVYQKWGGEQMAKSGDWLVNNNGEIYSIDQESFAATYIMDSLGLYFKSTPVWAKVATSDGNIPTKEGATEFKTGDYLVFNNTDGTDGYAMSAEKFESMYTLVVN
jgi:hypothetical protein